MSEFVKGYLLASIITSAAWIVSALITTYIVTKR